MLSLDNVTLAFVDATTLLDQKKSLATEKNENAWNKLSMILGCLRRVCPSYGGYPGHPSPLGYIGHMTPFILFPGRKTIKNCFRPPANIEDFVSFGP